MDQRVVGLFAHVACAAFEVERSRSELHVAGRNFSGCVADSGVLHAEECGDGSAAANATHAANVAAQLRQPLAVVCVFEP